MTATFPSSPEPSDPPLPPYRLSALLQAHTSDVRYLSVAPLASSPQLFSASRDGSARSWVQKEGVEWMQDKEWKQGHEGFANALCWIPPVEEEEDKAGYLATSGSDALIQLYSLSSPSSAPVQTLLGHAHNVCALHASKDGTKMVSASWDGTARVWERRREEEAREEGEEGEWTCERVLADHGAAVWDVLMLEEGGGGDSVLTACADSRIRLFDGDKLRHLFKGHEGPVRSLCVLLPEEADSTLFASGSNDGCVFSILLLLLHLTDYCYLGSTIRLWDWRTGTALSILGQQGSFVYSLAPIPSRAGGGLASSGEDGIIKIWNEEGREEQQVLVPALSVWTLATLPNGDLACGCSDHMIWIFTRDEQRLADEGTVRIYEERLESRRASKAPATPKPRVEGPAALDQPGKAEGEVKLVQADDEQVKAYQWDGTTWVELGEVVDPSSAASDATAAPSQPREKMLHEGVEYDYVFHIDVKDDEPPIPLPFNLEDDPHATASAFVEAHWLPSSYVERIVEFVRASTLA
ncbi:RHTO0S15e03378g1_1 [Rhodotorula toruloides]|uniref:RHTO0S15e03378g1_1 n=2 Tax=Rhodotorula toruloides TaxID=5286 RepID=A0A061BJ14_RHOTO|nr:ubiquitin homeostasis protein Lub1 [Rhodotorula toruloides NP11]EMS25428.1 ubiquitin homeostasis protein Lub1 [Rhodotorula toruloides NP11]CDR47896.1 RHTO0S15e03378g1_1 [Rhodotorula toruloides]